MKMTQIFHISFLS